MKKPSVLLVEDDTDIRNLYALALRNSGLKVFEAKDGKEGVALALKQHPQMILIDIILPGMSGHDAVQKIREDEWGRDAKIIYLTNLSDPDNVVSAVSHHPEEFIVKANTSIKEVVNLVRAGMYGT